MGNSSQYFPAGIGQHTVESLYAEHGPQRPWTYWLVLVGVVGALSSLPFIQVDVSVRAPGLVRPATDRAELRPAVSGHITEVLARDNDRVQAGQPLLVLRSRELEERLSHNRTRQAEQADLIADLQFLTASSAMAVVGPQVGDPAMGRATGSLRSNPSVYDGPVVGRSFQTAALRQENAQFLAQLDSYRLAETKARSELDRYTTLSSKGIATRQELDNARYEVERLQAESRLLVEQTLARWQARLREELMAQADLVSEAGRWREERMHYTVRAPADGVLVGFNGWCPGGFVAAGQSLGTVSPDDALQVETYVSPRNIGLVRAGQAARLQIDAYPHTQWGTLDGTVTAIGGDLVGGGAPNVAGADGGSTIGGFKVMVRPAASFLALPNGVRGELRKGLTLSARFLVARRSLLQLFSDDISNWLDPRNGQPRHDP